MSRSKRLVVAMSPKWVDEFVGPEGVDRLRSLFGDYVPLAPEGLSVDAWQRRLIELEPDAVLSGWGTRPIPRAAVPPVRLLAHTAGSVRHLVTREMIEGGLLVTNWGGSAAPAVAECALMLVLACLRRLNEWSFVMHGERGWVQAQSGDLGVGLYGRRIGIHGFGKIARQFAKLVAPFGCRLAAYSDGVPEAVYAAHGVRRADSLAALFAESEVVVDAEALTERSLGSVTEALLRSLPRGGVFVNVGRGDVVDEQALERVALDRHLEIGLDVYAVEPLPTESPLRGLPNVTLLPHVAGPTRDQRRACGRRAMEALSRFATGDEVANTISIEEFERST